MFVVTLVATIRERYETVGCNDKLTARSIYLLLYLVAQLIEETSR